jgi:predicted CXXCH cytochrome family protein
LIVKRICLFLVFFLCMFRPVGLLSGDWHTPDQSICSDCHTMHNSENGQPMRYDLQDSPAPGLLRHATALSLCIFCHDGSNPRAPDVIDPVAYVPDPAGGYFSNTGGVASGTAHNLAMVSTEVPPGGTDSMILTCHTCHDTHGNANYRNLRPNPGGSGNTVDVTVTVAQTVKPNGSNPAQVYIPSNLVFKSGMSQWCNACHSNFHGKTSGEEGFQSPWFRHPQDQTISTGRNVEVSYWRGSLPDRVPVQSPTDNVIPSDDDQVFCLSCHKAHGSRNKSTVIFADGATLNSTCQQCHYQ